MPFSAPVLTYRTKGLASNIQSKVLKAHNTLINIYITAILAPEMTYTPIFQQDATKGQLALCVAACPPWRRSSFSPPREDSLKPKSVIRPSMGCFVLLILILNCLFLRFSFLSAVLLPILSRHSSLCLRQNGCNPTNITRKTDWKSNEL